MLRGISVAFTEEISRSAHEEADGRPIPGAAELQFSGVVGRLARLEHWHVDAAHRAGLAGADATDAPRCIGAWNCDGASVCAAVAISAVDGLCGGSFQSTKTFEIDAGSDGHAGVGAG